MAFVSILKAEVYEIFGMENLFVDAYKKHGKIVFCAKCIPLIVTYVITLHAFASFHSATCIVVSQTISIYLT